MKLVGGSIRAAASIRTKSMLPQGHLLTIILGLKIITSRHRILTTVCSEQYTNSGILP